MANGEDGIREAAKSGDPVKVAAAHAEYAESMRSQGQNVVPLKDMGISMPSK